MQKHITFFLFSFVFIFFGFSQNAVSKLSEAQIKTAICHKWRLNLLEGKGKKITIPNDKTSLILGFLPDGNLYEFDGKKEYKGTWSYNHATLTITTIDQDGEEKHPLIDLNNDILVMKSKFKGIPFNMGFKKVD
ncbi:MAG: hypothetical protein IPL21_06425 [Saprospirales bacterium]|nr:hypothetical protein [Saprospirales bacterium]